MIPTSDREGSGRVQHLEAWALAVYERIDDISGGRIEIVRRALERFTEARSAQGAAAMAYYAVFSLFPLMLVLVAALGYWMTGEEAMQEAIDFVSLAVPVSHNVIENNLAIVSKLRGPITLVGLGGLLWSASGVFSVLAHNLNLAWPQAEPRSPIGIRLMGMAMVGGLFLLLVLSVVSNTVVDILQRIEEPTGMLAGGSILWEILSRVVPWLLALLLFLFLYRWVPNAKVNWKSAFWGALIAAVAWEILKNVFVWYLASELARYEIVYGSLGAVVVLMLWSYLSSWILLFGAHLAAGIGAASKTASASA